MSTREGMSLAITGLGLISPLGVSRAEWQASLTDPAAARKKAFAQDSEVADSVQGTAEVWGFDPKSHLGAKGHRSFDRLTKYLIAAAKAALEDAGIKAEGEFLDGAPPPTEVGICSATAYGSLDAITELNRVAELEDPRYINPTRFPNTVVNAAAGYVSIWEGLRAPNTTIVDGNCGALDAVLVAETHLQHERGDAFLVGGGEVMSEALHVALSRLGVLRTQGESPGVEIGEGACYSVVERMDNARARGARILAEIRGYGTAFEPPESEAVLVSASAEGVARAVRAAVEDAGLSLDEIDGIVGAAGGLKEIDAAETSALKDVFGKSMPVVASPKEIYGETFGAGGAFGIAVALAWMAGAPLGGSSPPHHVLVTTVGYYGNTTAVVVSQPGDGQGA